MDKKGREWESGRLDDKRAILQPSEWLIMEQLWKEHPQTIMQLYHRLETDPGWSKSTVITMLGRMVNKKIIYYEEGRKARQFYPGVERDEAAVAETKVLLQRVYRGSVEMMVDTLLRNRQISGAERIKLLQMLEMPDADTPGGRPAGEHRQEER